MQEPRSVAEPAPAAEPVEEEVEVGEDEEEELPAAGAGEAAAAAGVPAAASTPMFDAVTPSAALKVSAAAGLLTWPFMEKAAARQVETVAAGALHL